MACINYYSDYTFEVQNMTRQDLFNAINTERDYQDGKWGVAFDNNNTINDWVTYINQYASDAANMNATLDFQRSKLLKVATLAIAALEASYRNDGFALRHYDLTLGTVGSPATA